MPLFSRQRRHCRYTAAIFFFFFFHATGCCHFDAPMPLPLRRDLPPLRWCLPVYYAAVSLLRRRHAVISMFSPLMPLSKLSAFRYFFAAVTRCWSEDIFFIIRRFHCHTLKIAAIAAFHISCFISSVTLASLPLRRCLPYWCLLLLNAAWCWAVCLPPEDMFMLIIADDTLVADAVCPVFRFSGHYFIIRAFAAYASCFSQDKSNMLLICRYFWPPPLLLMLLILRFRFILRDAAMPPLIYLQLAFCLFIVIFRQLRHLFSADYYYAMYMPLRRFDAARWCHYYVILMMLLRAMPHAQLILKDIIYADILLMILLRRDAAAKDYALRDTPLIDDTSRHHHCFHYSPSLHHHHHHHHHKAYRACSE